MHIKLDWKQGMAFESMTPSGHRVTLDAGEDVGGLNLGPRPTEMLLQATATCTGIHARLLCQSRSKSDLDH